MGCMFEPGSKRSTVRQRNLMFSVKRTHVCISSAPLSSVTLEVPTKQFVPDKSCEKQALLPIALHRLSKLVIMFSTLFLAALLALGAAAGPDQQAPSQPADIKKEAAELFKDNGIKLW